MNYRYRNDDEMKDSGVEWIGKIPKEWNVTKLKNLATIVTGNTPSKNDEKNYENGIVQWIKPDNITDDFKITESKDRLSTYGLKQARLIPKNSALVCCIGTVGKVGISEVECTTNQQINSVVFDNKNWVNGFGIYALISSRNEHERNSSKVVVSILNKSQQGNINMPVPKSEEQQKISKFLNEKTAQFDSIISKKESLIEKLEEAKKSLISEVVTGKVRVVKTDDGYELVERKKEEMKDSGVEWLGDIPIEWDISKLKYIGESITGLTYSPKDIVDENKGILVLRSSNVQNGKIVFEDNVYVDMNIPDKLITKIGDIIICSRNGSRALIGKNACIREEQQGMSFGAFMTIFRSRYFEYLNFVFNSEIFKAQSGSFLTSTINQLTISNLNSFIIPLPNFKEQNIVVMYLREKISEYDKILDNIKMQIEKLKEAKQSLISEAVTGKIEILD